MKMKSVLPKRLVQFIENSNVDNESLNNYFRKVIYLVFSGARKYW